MLPKNSELTLLDLIEICLSKKFLIIFLTTIIGIFFCIIHVNFNYKNNFKSTIQIYPKLFLQIDEINKLQEMKNIMQDAVLDLDTRYLSDVNEKSMNFYLGYSSPARMVYEFTDMIKKSSSNNNYFKIF